MNCPVDFLVFRDCWANGEIVWSFFFSFSFFLKWFQFYVNFEASLLSETLWNEQKWGVYLTRGMDVEKREILS